MRVVLLWLFASAVVAYAGRHGRGGFWGTFFFSLLLSPLVGALAVIVTGPSRKSRKLHARARALSIAGHQLPPAVAAVQATDRSVMSVWWTLLFSWIAVILVFTVVFKVAESASNDAGFREAFEISFDTATFGIVGTNIGSGEISTRVLIAIERLIVIVLLIMKAARLVMLREARKLRRVREVAQSPLALLEDLHRPVASNAAISAGTNATSGASPGA
jgi:hypothetical protein